MRIKVLAFVVVFCFLVMRPSHVCAEEKGQYVPISGIAAEDCSFSDRVFDGSSFGIFLDNGLFVRVADLSLAWVKAQGKKELFTTSKPQKKANGGPNPRFTLIGYCSAYPEKCGRYDGVVTMKEQGVLAIEEVSDDFVRGWIDIAEGSHNGHYIFRVKLGEPRCRGG